MPMGAHLGSPGGLRASFSALWVPLGAYLGPPVGRQKCFPSEVVRKKCFWGHSLELRRCSLSRPFVEIELRHGSGFANSCIGEHRLLVYATSIFVYIHNASMGSFKRIYLHMYHITCILLITLDEVVHVTSGRGPTWLCCFCFVLC